MKKEKIHSVKYNFFMNFILNASAFIFPLITFPYISRVLQADGNGRITFVSSVANYFLMVASLGIPTYGIRACAQVRDNKEQLSKTVHEILFINIVTTILTIVTYVISIATISRFKDDEVLFLINGVSILLNVVGMNWLFQALEQYEYITIRSLVFKFISIILMFLLVHNKNDYLIYASITVFASVGSNILNFIHSRHFICFKWMGNYEIKKHIKPILILFAQNMAVSIYTNLDTVMLGFIKNNTDVGYYNAAVKIKVILLSLVSSLGNVLLPRMSYYAKENMKEEFVDTMKMSLNVTLLLACSLSIYFSAFSAECIQFIAGDGYIGAVYAMQIITIAVIPNGLTGILGIQVLTAIEKEKYVLCSVIVGASLDLVLNLLFIPNWGAFGAALATTLAEFSVLGVQIWFTRNLLKPIKKDIKVLRYLLLAVPALLISLTTKLLEIKLGFVKLVISSMLFFGIYLLELILIRDEITINFIENIMRKIRKKENV